MEVRLTRDADRLIAMIYKKYLERRKAGALREAAKCFGSSRQLRDDLALSMPLEDVDSLCFELHDFGYLSVLPADGSIYRIMLTNPGIADLENRFKDGLSAVIDFLSKFL